MKPVTKLRLFEYDSGKSVWLIDPCEIISSPYRKPFDEKDGYKISTSFTVDESFGECLKKTLPFKKETTPGGFTYYWYESGAKTLNELAELTGLV
ncbi:MAG TPA: hypothetical protein VK211_10110 [Kamptonema sp.]|nr:hypothetical protein [Kamptonema sp.]